MRAEITVDQAKLLRLRTRLKEAGATGLTRELNKELRLAAEPIKHAEEQAASALPSHKDHGQHGLRETLASNVRIGLSRSKYMPGVRIYIPKGLIPGWKVPGKDTAKQGWRHPVFGKGTKWVSQTSKPGWWLHTAREHSHQAEVHAVAAMDRIAARIMRP